MKKKIKFLIYFCLTFIDLFIKIFFIKDKKKFIFFINTEGGFGPSITRSHLLNLHYEEKWILLFGTKAKKHNKKLSKIFNNRLKFFFCGDFNQPENIVNFEKRISKVFFFIFNIKIKSLNLFIKDLKIDHVGKFGDQALKIINENKTFLFETGFFFKKENPSNFYKENFFQKNFDKIFHRYRSKNKGKINFFLRGKGKKYPNKRFIDGIRDSRDIDDYKPTLEYLVDSDYQIFITGEVTNIPDWIKKFGNSVVYLSKTDLGLDDYNLYVMSNINYFIGGSSGPPLFNCINNCKTLLLETNHIGISYWNSVVSYPKIKVEKLSDLKEIFMRCPYEDHYLEKIFNNNLIESLSKNDLKIITKEFIENINNDKYWKRAEDLGFLETHTHFMDAKISNYWLKLNNIEV